ncbi:MAG: hypothetical protein JNN15_07285 [Blastocatellia bacterium]|nr:hypothetical protein [Blastocatellia bacterium]
MSDGQKFITWCTDRPSGLNWVVFRPTVLKNGIPPEEGIIPTGEELGEYSSYVEARNAHPDARVTPSAAEAIKYGNI